MKNARMQYLFTLERSGYLVTLLIHTKIRHLSLGIAMHCTLKDFLLQMTAGFLKSSLWHHIVPRSVPPSIVWNDKNTITMIYFLRHT